MYFLLDANKRIVGNEKGYRTMRGAHQAYRYYAGTVWERFYSLNNDSLSVYSIVKR